jgi:hypothetical protein
MKAKRCAPALCGGRPDHLAAGTASRRLNFLAARLNGTEDSPKRLGIRRMAANIRRFPDSAMLQICRSGK